MSSLLILLDLHYYLYSFFFFYGSFFFPIFCFLFFSFCFFFFLFFRVTCVAAATRFKPTLFCFYENGKSAELKQQHKEKRTKKKETMEKFTKIFDKRKQKSCGGVLQSAPVKTVGDGKVQYHHHRNFWKVFQKSL